MTDWNSIRESAARLLNQPGLTETATWNGLSVPGVRTTLKREIVAVDDGLAGRYSFSFRVAASAFTDKRPKSRETMTLNGKTYRILSVEDDPIGATVLLNLGDETA